MLIHTTFIVLSPENIPIYHACGDNLDLMLNELSDYLSNEDNIVIGYDERWQVDTYSEFAYVYKWILSDHRIVYYGVNSNQINIFKDEMTLKRSLILMFSNNLLIQYGDAITNLTNLTELGTILRFANLSDPYIMLKSLFNITEDNMKQACVYLLNNLIEMYKDIDENGHEIGTKIVTDTFPELITQINNHIYKSGILSSKLKAVTTVYINMKISTAVTMRLK